MTFQVQYSATRVLSSVVERGSVLNVSGANRLETAIGGRPAILFISSTVDEIYGSGLRGLFERLGQPVIRVSTGEVNKTLARVLEIVEQVELLNFSRRGVFVAAGGGMLLDVVGLAASLYRRGVPVIKVGTTLLAQVDASIGVKCAVNSSGAKNLIGAFYAAERTVIDSTFLASLPYAEIRSGLSEITKLAIACDSALFESLASGGSAFREPNQTSGAICISIVDRAVERMISELEPNLYETELRRKVDFGHTISPSLEHAVNYSISHGDAVAIDMFFSSRLSNLLGLLPDEALARIYALYDLLGLPTWHPLMRDHNFVAGAFRAASAHRGMKLNLPLPVGIGSCEFISELKEISSELLIDLGRSIGTDL
jgi:3-dehydroquinate synthetase